MTVEHCLNELHDPLLAYHLAVHSNPLAEIDEVRTCVKPDTITLGLKHGGKRVADRTLAIRAANVDGAVTAMWMTEVRIECQRAFQPFLIRCCPYVLKHRGRVEQILNSLIVSHVYKGKKLKS